MTEVDLGRGPDDKRKRKTLYGKTRKEVAQKLQQLQATIQAGRKVDLPKVTVGEYLQRWLTDAAAPTLRPTTLESYTRYIRLHAEPAIGHVQLMKLAPADLQHLYSGLLAAGKSRRTVQYLHAILHRAFDQAVKWELLYRNPCDAVDAPRPARAEIQVLRPDQVAQLLEELKGDPLYALYYLAVMTGARRGELVALRWTDVDWGRPAININRTAEEIAGKGVIWTEPKTARSRRSIPLPAEAVEVLRAHQAEQAPGQELVFSRPDGKPVAPGHVSQHFRLLLEKAGLPKIRLHDLRHTHATLLLAADVHPKIVSERLGHSTITLTMDTYSHVLPTMQDDVTRKLEALLKKT